jgi:hypothetical protein
MINCFNFNYLIERSNALVEGYVYSEDQLKSDLTLSKKVQKELKKNHTLRAIYTATERYGREPIEECHAGNIAFDFGRFTRGIGVQDPITKQFTVNWIGSHEEFNKVRKQK